MRIGILFGGKPSNGLGLSQRFFGFCGFFACDGSKLSFVSFEHSTFQHGAELCVDRVYDVPIGIVRVLAAWHHDEKSFTCVNDFDVMYGKLTVEGDRCDGFHGAVVKDLADFDVCDFHFSVSLEKNLVNGYHDCYY